MIPDWFTNLLPIINAAGIPILAIAIVMLIKAYQNGTETYRNTASHLQDENKRLREQLRESDNSYLSGIEKIREIGANSLVTMKELQARKDSLLAESSASQEILAEVKKINETIEILEKISVSARESDVLYQVKINSLENKVEELLFQVGILSIQISDTQSRKAILNVTNYYKILQVDPEAEIEVIESAYKRLALKYHPDINKSPNALEIIKVMNEARKVLINPDERKKYDRVLAQRQ